MARYHLVTVWHIDAPVEPVWDTLFRAKEWPSWWAYVESVVELEPGDETGLGTRRRLTWRTRLPYSLSFDARVTRVEPPVVLEASVEGELEGFGRWSLSREGDEALVRYDWNVATTKLWMNLMAPLARPLFAWNHHAVMRQGGEGLAERLGVKFLGMDRGGTGQPAGFSNT